MPSPVFKPNRFGNQRWRAGGSSASHRRESAAGSQEDVQLTVRKRIGRERQVRWRVVRLGEVALASAPLRGHSCHLDCESAFNPSDVRLIAKPANNLRLDDQNRETCWESYPYEGGYWQPAIFLTVVFHRLGPLAGQVVPFPPDPL